MQEKKDPQQLALFAELADQSSIPSIVTLPEFDRALNNLIQMSDLGAFIQLNIQGLEKLFTLNVSELGIPADFLKNDKTLVPLAVHLFPHEIRNHLKKFSYDVKSFFNNKNSFRTSFGYFLFRSHFSIWKHYLEKMEKTMNDYLYNNLGKGVYGHYFLSQFKEGYDYLQSVAEITAPWEFHEKLLLKDIDLKRKELATHQKTLYTIKPTELEFPFEVMVLKTNHIPLTLHDFIAQVNISSIFKTIHLEYLANISIKTIEDIKELTETI